MKGVILNSEVTLMISLKTFLHIVAIIFFIVGSLHLLRLFTGFQVILGGWTVPMWLSIFGVLIPWYLVYIAFTYSKKNKPAK
jgi:hypothetical protein